MFCFLFAVYITGIGKLEVPEHCVQRRTTCHFFWHRNNSDKNLCHCTRGDVTSRS